CVAHGTARVSVRTLRNRPAATTVPLGSRRAWCWAICIATMGIAGSAALAQQQLSISGGSARNQTELRAEPRSQTGRNQIDVRAEPALHGAEPVRHEEIRQEAAPPPAVHIA